ncbi:MAG: ATP-binding cassette domain-containing protein [Castellaniella sp.]
MIRAQKVTMRRGTQVLLEGADFVIHPGERLGLVGRNGAGKSSLFSVLKGEIDLDAGTLMLPEQWRIAGVEQILDGRERPAREFVIDGDRRLRGLQAERAAVPDDQGTRIAELEAQLVEAGAWDAPARAEQLLSGLGFAPDDWMRPVGEFSGGWQMRLALARALMAPSELLLLDEPTNHLDLDAMLWLERWLAAYPGTAVIISHDTEFLDATVSSILHFDQRRLHRYRGSYQSFEEQRAERLRQNTLAHARQAGEAARMQAFITRFRAKASKARQAQSRMKALARMQTLAPLHVDSGIALQLPEPDRLPDPLLQLEDATLGYPGHTPVLSGLNLTVRGGARIGVLGVNGAGKSTLVKTLAGVQAPLSGHLQASRGLVVGYFAQHQLDMLDADASPLEHLRRIAPDANEQTLRNTLASFGFTGDRVNEAAGPFSGGEKARLALALMVWHRPNLLLLDEPSNHLDVETREALATALAGYGGSLLLVSHDRHLLRTTVDDFWIVADGAVTEFDGDLDDYRQWLAQRNSGRPAGANNDTTSSDTASASDRRAQRREEARARQRLAEQRKPLLRQLKAIEAGLDDCSIRLKALDAHIADPDFYTDAQRDARPGILAEHGELLKRQQSLESDWLDCQEALEQLEAGD